MNIIMNLKRKFKITGKESSSVEETHHDIQEASSQTLGPAETGGTDHKGQQ